MSLPPLENILVGVEPPDEEPEKLDIFFLRYNTPAIIMETITREMNRMRLDPNLAPLYIFRLGVFRMSYILEEDVMEETEGNRALDREPKLEVFRLYDVAGTYTINRSNTVPPLPPGMSDNDYFAYITNYIFTTYPEFISAMINKTFFEQLIRRRFRGFENQCFSIDLYFNRPNGQVGFHTDSDEGLPVNFFTLTYILPENIEIVGPTIVTTQNLDHRASFTPTVMHGTTIGIDNEVVMHSTPDIPLLRAPAAPYLYQGINGTTGEHLNFVELRPPIQRSARQQIAIENSDRQTRTFVRTWFFAPQFVHIYVEDRYNDYYQRNNLRENLRNFFIEFDSLEIIGRHVLNIENGIVRGIDTESVLRDPRVRRYALGGKNSGSSRSRRSSNTSKSNRTNRTNTSKKNSKNSKNSKNIMNIQNILLDPKKNIIIYKKNSKTIGRKTLKKKRKGGMIKALKQLFSK